MNPIVLKNADIMIKTNRSSNLELYRIIVMFLIVSHHYVVNSGLLDEMLKDPFHIKSLFAYSIGIWGKTGINCFVMITGYFMCKSEISLYKFMKLLSEVLFYNIIIRGLFFILSPPLEDMSLIGLLCDLFIPLQSVGADFVSCFLIFYLCIPFLNILVHNMTKEQHLLLMVLMVFTYTFLSSVFYVVVFNYVVWFSVLYVIASYVRLYDFQYKESRVIWMRITLFLMLLAFIVGLAFGLYRFNKNLPVYWLYIAYWLSDSNKIFALLIGISSFMWFRNMNISFNQTINSIAAGTFGVLLIHANSDAMRNWLWKEVCDVSGFYYSNMFFLHAILVPICIFFVCNSIDWLRRRFFEPHYMKLVMQYSNKLKEKYINYANR